MIVEHTSLNKYSVADDNVEAVTNKAQKVIDDDKNIRLSLEGAETVFNALDNPRPINNKLLEAARSFNKNGGFTYAGNSSTQQRIAQSQ